jgi:hypothetical protein
MVVLPSYAPGSRACLLRMWGKGSTLAHRRFVD